MVRDLRDRTGAGMMDCKKALVETEGDLEAAEDHLRKQGLKSAEKKAGRDTGEGRVFSVIGESGHVGSMVSISCETDFVAKTPDFQQFLQDLCDHVAANDPTDVDAFHAQAWQGGDQTGEGAVKTLIGKLGENMGVSGVRRMENSNGHVISYVHHDDKKGAMVSVTSEADAETAAAVLKDLCMHIVVYSPDGLNREEIPQSLIEREKAIYMEAVAGKPEEMKEKIVAGKLEKFFAGRVLTEQPWVKDDKLSVQKALEAALGAGTKLEAFARFQVGS